jgi:nitroreductase
MPDPNPAALEFLLNRRSRPARTLRAPAPNRDQLMPILMAAARSPDHAKLEPWRFIVLQGAALRRLSQLSGMRGRQLDRSAKDIDRAQTQFDQSHLAVVVVASPKPSEKVPAIEQSYSAGAVCLALLNAALASGWGANWLSGWVAHDREFRETGLGLDAHERIAGIIHIGTESTAPPERPRPDPDAITSWVTR